MDIWPGRGELNGGDSAILPGEPICLFSPLSLPFTFCSIISLLCQINSNRSKTINDHCRLVALYGQTGKGAVFQEFGNIQPFGQEIPPSQGVSL